MRLIVLISTSLLLPAVWGTIVAWGVNRVRPRGATSWLAYTGKGARKAPVDYQI